MQQDNVYIIAKYETVGLLSFLSKLKVIGRWAAFDLDDKGTTIPIDLRSVFKRDQGQAAS